MQLVSPRAGKRPASRLDSFIQVRHVAALALMSLSVVGLLAAPIPSNKPSVYPAWWFGRSVIVPTNPTNASPSWPTDYPASDDYAVVNEGQLKNLATRAYNELLSSAPTNVWATVNGEVLASMVTNWSPTTGDPYLAMNLGQLKNIAKPFYDVLTQIGYTSAYPWTGSGADDYAAANLGQAKYAFSFDVGAGTSTNGVPNWWENKYFPTAGYPSTDLAPSGNGSTLGQDYNQGDDPTNYYSQGGQIITPTLTIEGTNPQTGFADGVLSLVVKVTNSAGTALSNAPVTFTVTAGNGGLTTDSLGLDTLVSMQVNTLSDGTASIYFVQPDGANITSTIAAASGGQSVTFTATTLNFTPAIAGGTFQSLALPDTGNLQQLTGSDPPSTPVGLSGVTAMAVGDGHSVALENDGKVYAWGNDGNGQLGDGNSGGSSDSPVMVRAAGVGSPCLTGITSVAAGSAHTLALQSGQVLAWGSNDSGQLGNGTTTDSVVPVAVTFPSGTPAIVAIAASGSYSMALDASGNVWVWGDDTYNQLGDGGALGESSTPVQITGVSNVTSISAGYITLMALETDPTTLATSVWTWGNDGGTGTLGQGDTPVSPGPGEVSGLSNVTSIAAAYATDYAVESDGTVWAWGYNGYDELGNNPNSQIDTPAQVTGFTNTGGTVAISSVTGNGYSESAVALGMDGTIWTWGGGNPTPAMVSLRISTLSTDLNFNGIPDSWEVGYFGSIFPNSYVTDGYSPSLASDGNTIIQDYQLGLAPVNTTLRPIPNVVVDVGPGNITLTWTIPPGNPVANVEIQQKTGGGSWTTIATLAGGTTSYSPSGLDPSQSYQFQVIPLDSSGNAGAPTTAANAAGASSVSPLGQGFARFAVINLDYNNQTVGPIALTNKGSIFFTQGGSAYCRSASSWSSPQVLPFIPSSVNNQDFAVGAYGTNGEIGEWPTGGDVTPDLTEVTNPFTAAAGCSLGTNYGIASVGAVDDANNIYVGFTKYYEYTSPYITNYLYGEGYSVPVTNLITAVGAGTLSGSEVTEIGNPGCSATVGQVYTNYPTWGVYAQIDNSPTYSTNNVVAGAPLRANGSTGAWLTNYIVNGAAPVQNSPISIVGLNSAGQMIGLDSNGVPAAVNAPYPNNLTEPGEWNTNNQVVYNNGTYYYEKGTNYLINTLIPTNSGWASFVAGGLPYKVINDSGAIIGTATYTGTNYATGSHGVLLAPIAIQRRVADQTNYAPINTSQQYPQNVIVSGQLMDLKLVQTSTTYSITNIHWVIDGTNFKSYTATPTVGTLTQFSASDLNNQTVQFYWADSGTKNVECTFNIGPSQGIASLSFKVVEPTATLTRPVTRGTVAVAPPGYYSGDTNYYLTTSQTGSSGISYTYTWTPISNDDTAYPLEVRTVQLITPNRSYEDANGKVWNWVLNGQKVLDGGAMPYPRTGIETASSVNGSDTPADQILTGVQYDKISSETYDVYLMCRSLQGTPGNPVDPDASESEINSVVSSAWVPISHFTWTWAGEADPSGAAFVLKSGSGSAPQPASEQALSIQPQWTANSLNHTYQ